MTKIDKNIERDKLLQEIGARAKEIFIKSKFKSQTELRNFVDNKFSEAMLSDFFAGQSNITIYNFWLIVKAIECSADYILFGREQKPLLSTRSNKTQLTLTTKR